MDLTDTKIVCGELRDIGNSVGFKCINMDNIVFCVRSDIILLHSRYMVDSNMWFMSISDIVLAVENGVVLCLKSRFTRSSDYRKVSWCLSDPNSFDCISSWFKEQVVKYRQYNNSFNNIS